MDKKSTFWKTFITALEAEPQDIQSLPGASGLTHPIIILGVDEQRGRVIIVSGESNPRAAAMAHSDIQSRMPSFKVLMARPISVNLHAFTKTITEYIGKTSIGLYELKRLSKMTQKGKERAFKKAIKVIAEPLDRFIFHPSKVATIDPLTIMIEALQQVFLIEWSELKKLNSEEMKNLSTIPYKSLSDKPLLDFSQIIAIDPTVIDRQAGICSIPLYDFSQEEAETFHSGIKIDQAKEILKSKDVLQYFFPAPDHLSLGLVEQGSKDTAQLVKQLLRVPEFGHPFGDTELVSSSNDFFALIESLQLKGLLVEGEVGLEVGECGKPLRAAVRFKPRESIFKRLSNIFSIKIDLSLKDIKDVFKSSP